MKIMEKSNTILKKIMPVITIALAMMLSACAETANPVAVVDTATPAPTELPPTATVPPPNTATTTPVPTATHTPPPNTATASATATHTPTAIPPTATASATPTPVPPDMSSPSAPVLLIDHYSVEKFNRIPD